MNKNTIEKLQSIQNFYLKPSQYLSSLDIWFHHLYILIQKEIIIEIEEMSTKNFEKNFDQL